MTQQREAYSSCSQLSSWQALFCLTHSALRVRWWLRPPCFRQCHPCSFTRPGSQLLHGGGIWHSDKWTGHWIFFPTEGSGSLKLSHNVCSENRFFLNSCGLTFSEANLVGTKRACNPRWLGSHMWSQFCLNLLLITSFEICNQILNYSPFNIWKCWAHLVICSSCLSCTPGLGKTVFAEANRIDIAERLALLKRSSNLDKP